MYSNYRNNYYGKMRKKKRLPPAVLLIPLCAALAVCIAVAVYLHRGQGSGAEKYYRDNSKLIDMISLEDSYATLNEMQVMFDLAGRGFTPEFDDDGSRIGYPVTYHYAPDGGFVEETEVSIISTDKHPMYQTFYVSGDTEENRIGWVIDVVNGEVFARPVSFLFETTCDKEILLTEDKEGKVTSYCDGTFYITVPHKTAATTVIVDKINAETLDGITFDDLCTLTGAARLPSADVGSNSAAALSLSNDLGAAPISSLTKAVSNETAIIVSLGDSFSSGEGNEPFGQKKTLLEKVIDEDWLAHRSTTAWPTQLVVANKKVELHFAAVSGAVTENIDQKEQPKTYKKDTGTTIVTPDGTEMPLYIMDKTTLPVQLDIFDTDKITGKAVDFVTLTIGGNDVGFKDIITQCVMGSTYLENALYDGTILAAMLNNIRANLNDTLNDIGNVYEAIAVKAPYAAILVAGYPKLLDAKGQYISKQEAELVNKAVSDFNDEIEELVKACWRTGMNIYFVDVETKFDGHEAYATDENGNDIAWLNRILLRSQPEDLIDGEPSAYSIHPNKFGVQAYAACVNEEIAAYAESGDFGNNLHWKYDIRTDTLTISGTGDMPNFVELVEVGQQSFPWERFMHRIKEVIIEDGITSIGSFSFYEFDKLERVEIRGAVSKIGYRAFFGCDKLSAISNFPERLSDIGEGAFYGDALTDFYFAGDPPAALEASAGTYAASFAYGANGDTDKIILHYPAAHKDKWDPDGDGKWKGYRVDTYDIKVSGTVYDRETYERLKNATVQITKQGDEKVYETVTDANGNFTVNIPGFNQVTLTIKISAEGYETQTLRQTSDTRGLELVIHLAPQDVVDVTVTVISEDGKRLSGITIGGTGLGPAPVTDVDGAAKFKLSAGTYELTVSDGKNTAKKTLTVTSGPVELEITFASAKVKQVSLNYDQSAAITEDGSLYTWGYNKHGELGNGTATDSSTPVKIMDNVAYASLGNWHSAAITTDGSLYMWGVNSNGQCGIDRHKSSSAPVKIMDNVAYVSLGSSFSAAITTDGSLYTWGCNWDGRLGNGTTTDSSTPIKIMDNVAYVSLGDSYGAAITTDGSLYMWGVGELGIDTTKNSSTPIKIMDNVEYVSLGSTHAAAITTGGSLYMWGKNWYGGLGNGTTEDSTTPIKIMDNVADVSIGYWHSAAITTDGSLYMWGYNDHGQLGNGKGGLTARTNTTPIKIMDNVADISIGNRHSAAITTDGSFYTWGYNQYGQLGNGTDEDSYTPIKITLPDTSDSFQ